MTHHKRKSIRLLVEEQPDPAVIRRVDEIEMLTDDQGDRNLGGMTLPTLEEYLRSLLPGHVHGFGVSYPPDGRTDAPPGSKDKVKVMAQRASKGQSLFHPEDNRTLPDAPLQEEDEFDVELQATLSAARQDSHRRRHAVASGH